MCDAEYLVGPMKTLKFATGSAIAIAFFANAAAAQEERPESILPQERTQQTEAATPPPAATAPAASTPAQSVGEAFGDMQMQSGEIVQEIPSLEGVWSVEQVEELLAFIPTVKAEGLRPSDYRADELRETLAVKGPGGDVNRIASEIFVWLVEDLRDGRTPMESRRQWFVVDPDADRKIGRAHV